MNHSEQEGAKKEKSLQGDFQLEFEILFFVRSRFLKLFALTLWWTNCWNYILTLRLSSRDRQTTNEGQAATRIGKVPLLTLGSMARRGIPLDLFNFWTSAEWMKGEKVMTEVLSISPMIINMMEWRNHTWLVPTTVIVYIELQVSWTSSELVFAFLFDLIMRRYSDW